MPQSARPPFIRHYEEIQNDDTAFLRGSNERRSIGSPFSAALGLTRLGIHHELLPPGRRTSFPHAESAEEEFVYVIEGTPDVWIDGELFRLVPGDGVGFPAGTGIAHTFLNNTDEPVRLLVVGEPAKPENRVIYPIDPEVRPLRDDWWEDAPVRPLGSHDGKPRQPE
ncbi:MAG TPA: cupin domain-containing protein [Microvirga sp.]|jgi:uncharacterized cupin superfamily protein|nr:cupin domain-containing protein [Microvirga sp.]